jgi:hypothetical protein
MSKQNKSNKISMIKQLLEVANASKLEAVLELLTTNNSTMPKSTMPKSTIPKSSLSKTVVNDESGKTFKISKVKGDGTCFYHSVVQAGKNKDIDGLAERDDGNDLRSFLIRTLENFRVKPDQLFVPLVNGKSAIANSLNNEMKQSIINTFEGIQKENGIFNNVRNTGNTITQERLKEMLGVIIRNLTTEKWGGGPILQILASILPICVKYYNTATGKFELVKSNVTECTEENTIYIYYNGSSHYDALEEVI